MLGHRKVCDGNSVCQPGAIQVARAAGSCQPVGGLTVPLELAELEYQQSQHNVALPAQPLGPDDRCFEGS